MKPTTNRAKAPRPTPTEKATQRELRQLYGWPTEMDDDLPHHLHNQPSWVDLVGQR